MPFSPKAQEIHDQIVHSRQTDYWTDVARTIAERRCQHRPGRHHSGDVHALTYRLQAELSHAVKNAHVHNWEEIAHWLVYEARQS